MDKDSTSEKQVFQLTYIVKKRKFLFAFVAIFIFFIFLCFEPQKDYVLNASCMPDGFMPEMRSQLQGRNFWVGQLDQLNRNIENIKKTPQRMMEANKIGEEALAQNKNFMESIYSTHPDLRPQQWQAMADNLDDQADSLKAEANDIRIYGLLMGEMNELIKCRKIVEQKM